MTPIDCDALVLGGGPAGCVMATRLVDDGFRVVLVERGSLHRSGPYETVLAGGRSLLGKQALQWVEAAAVSDPLRHGAIWGDGATTWRSAGEPGLLLHRGRFDAALRRTATEHGVTVHEPATATPRDDGSWHVTVTGQAPTVVQPRLVVDATGRASWRGQRTAGPRQPRTWAFGCVGEPDPADRNSAVVEAVGDGWIWTHAPSDGLACATVLLDADVVAQQGRTAVLQRALASARGPAGRLRNFRVQHATDATPRQRTTPSPLLRIGDAAATIDPLASQGVEKAIAAADHAAAVAATALRQQGWRSRLFAAHERWERGLQAAHQRTANGWYRREQRFAEQAFWTNRHTAEAIDVSALPTATQLRLADGVRRGEVLVRDGARFVARSGAINDHTGEELSHLGHVPIPALLDLFAKPMNLGAATAAGGRDARLFVLAPAMVLAALQQLQQRGWLHPV